MLKICRTILKGKSSWPALPVAVLSVFCCFFFSNNAKAENLISDNYSCGWNPGVASTYYWGQSFVASSTNLSAFSFYYNGTDYGDNVSVNWVVCSNPNTGNLDPYGPFNPCDPSYSGVYVMATGTTSILRADGWQKITLDSPVNTKINSTYGITFIPNDNVSVCGEAWTDFASGKIAGTYGSYTGDFSYRLYETEIGPTGSIYWAGVGTQALYKGEINRIPFYYNICSDWETFKSYDDELWVEIKQGETQIASSYYVNFRVPLYDNSECKGFRYISMDSGLVNIAATGTMDIILRNDPATSTEKIYGQNTFFYNYDWRDGLTYFNRLFNSPLIIPQKTGTSTITFEYGFNELNVDRVCWFNEDWQVLNTDVCTSTDQIDNEGIGGLDLPNQITKTIYKGSFAAVDTSNNILLKTEPFQIVWANDWKDAFSEIASSTDDSLLKLTGLSAHDLACTQEEWAESTESWFNWQKLKCNSLYSMFFAGEVITNAIKIFVKTTSDIILTIFPLNIPKNIIQQWNLSEGKNLPAGLEMLTPQDENGNIYITLSPELAGATSTIQIWGEEIYYATPGLETFFNFIKEFTKILLWLLVLVEIIGIGFQILKDINHEEEPDFELSSIHYDSKGQYSASYRPKK